MKQPRRILLIGGNSAIGRALAVELGGADCELSVTVRDTSHFQFPRGIRPGSVSCVDLSDLSTVGSGVSHAFAEGGYDMVIVAAGVLGPAQTVIDAEPRERDHLLAVNVTGTVALLDELAGAMTHHGGGELLYLSSLAAVRARHANALYGRTKAAVEKHLRTLAVDGKLSAWVLRLGFVHTPMTAGMPARAFALTAAQVATQVRMRVHRKRSARRRAYTIIYVPRVLHVVAAALRLLPAPVIDLLDHRAQRALAST